jgi:tetratricopeptide (TPR) repeat protein
MKNVLKNMPHDSVRMSRPILLLALILATTAQASVLTTTDGQQLEGDIKRVADGWAVTNADGKTTVVPITRVQSIELSRATSSSKATAGLESLRRSVEHSDDLKKIIERYKRFIDASKDNLVTIAAQQDLLIWQKRLNEHHVKLGKQWVTPGEKQQMLALTLVRVDEARTLIKANNLKQAQSVIDELLRMDSQNVSALYLSGVIRSRQKNVPEAKKSFQAVIAQIEDHAPTQLNLAVINAQQKQWGPACAAMQQALISAPGVQVLIDTTAELLAMLPEDQQKTPVAQKLSREFTSQDAALQKVMNARKMYRWGATWVDTVTREKLSIAEAELKTKLNAMQKEFDQLQTQIQQIDLQSKDISRSISELESRSVARASDGTLVRLPYPTAYYDLQRDLARLRGDRIAAISQLDTLRESARRARTELPVPQYTGILNMIEEDGVPVIMPDTPPAAFTTKTTTQPATKPATRTAPPPPIIRIGPADNAE